MSEEKYDSTKDTWAHKANIQFKMNRVVRNLLLRAEVHDNSKLEEPEKSLYDKCTIKLNNIKYGTPEYFEALKELKPALDHHYKENSHHPEHTKLYKCGVCNHILKENETWIVNINDHGPRLCSKCCPNIPIYECEVYPYIGMEGMSLFDLIELLCDWKASSERMSNGGNIYKSIEINKKRFNISDQLEQILINTAKEMGWEGNNENI